MLCVIVDIVFNFHFVFQYIQAIK